MFLILGGNGYVGTAFQMHLQQMRLPFEVISRSIVDYSDESSLMRLIDQRRPEFLINAAGYTGRPNVDACEVHRTECLQGNAVLPGVIRSACKKVGLPWGHVSSGCIYTGAKPDGSGFTEVDAANFSFRQNNCSFYSGCKALGEELLSDTAGCYVWRLRIPFNEVDGPRNYISKMMRYDCLLKATNSLSQLDEFAAACIACWTKRVPFGTYNLTNPGSVTTEDVVAMIKRFGLTQKVFQFFDSEDQFMKLAAKTPRSNCVLDTTKAEQLKLPMRPIVEALEIAMRAWVKAHA